MLYARNDRQPRIDSGALVCASARVIGDVRISSGGYVDHSVTIASGGPPIEIAEEVIVLAGTVIRSVGGRSRPASGVTIGRNSLVSRLCAP
jgi:carbonic anhydrase/acetyltransferase-like protein (isoleucine patch superfamily)